jgi:hypothetical protein
MSITRLNELICMSSGDFMLTAPKRSIFPSAAHAAEDSPKMAAIATHIAETRDFFIFCPLFII